MRFTLSCAGPGDSGAGAGSAKRLSARAWRRAGRQEGAVPPGRAHTRGPEGLGPRPAVLLAFRFRYLVPQRAGNVLNCTSGGCTTLPPRGAPQRGGARATPGPACAETWPATDDALRQHKAGDKDKVTHTPRARGDLVQRGNTAAPRQRVQVAIRISSEAARVAARVEIKAGRSRQRGGRSHTCGKEERDASVMIFGTNAKHSSVGARCLQITQRCERFAKKARRVARLYDIP